MACVTLRLHGNPGDPAAAFGEATQSNKRKPLRYGQLLHYGYVIYNARLDKLKKQPQLQTQICLLRDGREVFTGRVHPLDTTGQTDMKQLVAGGRLQVGSSMLPGQYILEVIVTDQLANEKFRTVTQWIDFEVMK